MRNALKLLRKIGRKIQRTYWKVWPYNYRPSEILYNFKAWWKKPNRISSRYVGNRWIDKRELLPEMVFEILSRFIEEECSPGHVDWVASDHRIEVNGVSVNVRDEMQYLYDWWHKTYKKKYVKEDEEAWKQIALFQGKMEFIGKNKTYQQDEDWDDDEHSCLMEFRWESEEKEKIYRELIERQRNEQARIEKELIENMCRVCRLTPYLWT